MSTAYTSFVRDKYPSFKANHPETNSKDILRLIAAEWNRTKPPKEQKEKKPKTPRVPKEKKAPASAASAYEPHHERLDESIHDVEESVHNIEDALQTNPPSSKIVEKVLKSKSKAPSKKRKKATVEDPPSA